MTRFYILCGMKYGWLFLFLVCSHISEIHGQINIKVGYGLGFPNLSAIDDLLSGYQPVEGEVVESFGSLGFIHGIQLGLRYRIANTGLEVGWETMSRDLSALIFEPSNDSFTDRTYSFGLNSLHVGVEHYFDRYGLGIALHSQKLGIERPIGNNDLVLADQRKGALRLMFIWQVQESDSVALMIKPYYQFPLASHDISRFADELGTASLRDDSLSMFGLSFVFYNGRQR